MSGIENSYLDTRMLQVPGKSHMFRSHPISHVYVPFLLASSGLMSKTSTPCIFPRISRRSRPVDCSRSVGMVPGAAPVGDRRSFSLVISAGGRGVVSAKVVQ
jgi:hypothetical protein